jgi:hypothetical protein
MRPSVLYVGGCGRSGSTLLDRLLGQVPGVFAIGEVVHIWRRGVAEDQLCGCGKPFTDCEFWSAVGETAFGGWTGFDVRAALRLQRSVDRNRFIPLMLAPSLSTGYRRDLDAYTAMLDRLYAAIGEVSGASLVVDSTKHASYAFLMRRLPSVDLRVAHLVRDSRGVAYSWTKEVRKPEVVDSVSYMPRYHPLRMGTRWVAYNGLFHLLRRSGVPTSFVRYEQLVADPRTELRRLLAFAGVPANDLPFLGEGVADLTATHSVAGNPMRFKNGRIALRVDEEWRTAMPGRHRALVSAVTWPLMRAYGYRS